MTLAKTAGRALLIALACAIVLPSAARAQSAIAGTVRDSSGAVLPGVTVEASSPVLIERVRSVVTNAQGQFNVVDLRPGVYKVTFTLPGFTTFIRDGLELGASFTATINATLRVGGLEETITVSGASPTVDVQSTARVQVLTRETLDSIPNGRSIFSTAQLVTGVTMNVPDVGGSRAMQQTYMSTRGLTSANNIVQVDGLMINGLDGDGAVQQYVNNAMVQEMTYQTAGAGADVSPGGVRVNIIPRDGGNAFKGYLFAVYNPGQLQSDNYSPELKARGLAAVDKIQRIYDINPAYGGPIKRDKLWFFGTARFWSVNSPIADTFYVPPGATQAQCQAGTITCEQGIDDQKIKSALVRLMWQVTPRNKLAVYYDEIDKYRGHGMNAGNDPRTASQVWTSPIYNDGSLKVTSTISSRLLLENGFSFNAEEYVILNQPGVNQLRGTAAWYAGASRRDQTLGTLWSGFGSGQGGRYPDRFNVQSGLAYVTGSHNVKTGYQFNWGPYENTRETNADLQQVYSNGVPSFATVYNTPLRYHEALVGDLGLYAQDTWTLNRLTINGGVRWEYLKSQVSAQESPAGRFIGARKTDAIPMPIWKDLAPRFGIIYDLKGDSRTALKFGLNRYNESRTTLFANAYNPLRVISQNLTWTDINGDDIAQGELGCVYLTAGCELNFAQLPSTFGSARLSSIDPNFKRVYNVETTAGVQHELFPRISVNGNFYRRTFHRLKVTDNVLRTMSDYQALSVFHPITGQPFTIYDVTPAALSRVEEVDKNAGSERSHVYTGFDFNVNARLPRGGTLFGGLVTERNLRNVCDEPDNPMNLLFCDDSQNDIPFRPTLKMSGSYPLGFGVSVSATMQSLAGRPLGGTTTSFNKISGPGYGDTGSPVGTNWLLTNTTRYPADCPAPCPAGALVFPGTARLTSASVTAPLVAPGTEFLPRLTQVDLGVAKSFTIGSTRLQGQFDLFNVTNENTELSYRSTNYATAAYLQPSSVLQGRMVRLGVQLNW